MKTPAAAASGWNLICLQLPSMYFSGSKRKTAHELSGLYQIPRDENVFNFNSFSSIREKKKARVKLRQNERFSVFFPPIVDLFDLSKSVPQG